MADGDTDSTGPVSKKERTNGRRYSHGELPSDRTARTDGDRAWSVRDCDRSTSRAVVSFAAGRREADAMGCSCDLGVWRCSAGTDTDGSWTLFRFRVDETGMEAPHQ